VKQEENINIEEYPKEIKKIEVLNDNLFVLSDY
jgi:hypothetical protein